MDSDQGKLFIGGISWETSEEKLKEHFGRYGEVLQAVVMRDKLTSRPRGFGFVAFADPSVLDRVLVDQHTIDGRTVEAKRALSRDEQHTSARPGNTGVGRGGGGGGGGGVGGSTRTKKIFVGGLPPDLTEDRFRQYFELYGSVTDTVVMYDAQTQRPRGFGFISFDSEDSVDKVLHKTFHELNGKLVEVKRALPRDGSSGNTGGRSMGGGGGYQSYGGTGANTGSYDRADASRYVQPQSTAGGAYPTYGPSGYAAPGYGYGQPNNGAGVYGSYGVGGYGTAAGGYGGPAAAYGNPNAPAAGYASGQPGAPRSPWNSQPQTGYGSAGYGGAAGSWNAPAAGGSTVAPPTGQSPSTATGYGSQGYGYGGYGAREGSYGAQGGYGNVGGRSSAGPDIPAGGVGEQGAGPGYMGGGYGDASSGYPASWRSDPSQGGYAAGQVNGNPGGQPGYGGGYGGAQARQ